MLRVHIRKTCRQSSSFHLMPSSKSSSFFSVPGFPSRLLLALSSRASSSEGLDRQGTQMVSRFSVSLWLSPLFCRRSGTDWQGTLFLIRQMAWGETLIWTSSASKRTALPGWAQRPGTANYNTLMLLSHWLIHSIRACVCVCERESERRLVIQFSAFACF